jgi:transposase
MDFGIGNSRARHYCREVGIKMEQRNEGSVAKKRGSWTMEQKRAIMAEADIAGTDIGAVAHRHGVRTALLSSWRRQLSRRDKASAKVTQFAAVRVSTASAGVIEIDLDSRCVRVHGLVDGWMLREVLAATR